MKKMTLEEAKKLCKTPAQIAAELVNVQPMPSTILKDLYDALGTDTWVLTSGNTKNDQE